MSIFFYTLLMHEYIFLYTTHAMSITRVFFICLNTLFTYYLDSRLSTTGSRRHAALEDLFEPAGVEGRAGGLKDSPSRAASWARPWRGRCPRIFR